MLQVTSTLVVKPEFRDQALALAQRHVAASLREEGCISHAVYLHPTNTNEFFFFERWQDDAALQLHFAKPYSVELVKQMGQWALVPMSLTLSVVEGETTREVGT